MAVKDHRLRLGRSGFGRDPVCTGPPGAAAPALPAPIEALSEHDHPTERTAAMSKKLETVSEVARNRGLPQRRIYELVRYAKDHPGENNNIPFIAVGSRIYFRDAALDAWFESLETVA
jgi:hypothetical protein